MAEGRKRKKMDSSSSSSSSSSSKEPLNSPSELPHSLCRSVSKSGSPSCESLKSDDSMFHPLNFRKSPSSLRSVSESESPTCESLKSDGSMGHPLSFRKSLSSLGSVSESESPSCESLKSDGSMGHPLTFKKSPSLQFRGTEPGASTTESMMSDSPEHQPVNLHIENIQSHPTRCSACKEVRETTHLTCGHWTCQECVGSDWDQSASPPGYSCPKCGKKPKMKSGKINSPTNRQGTQSSYYSSKSQNWQAVD